MEWIHLLTDVEGLVRWGGYLGLSLIVFTETGLMVGFFLPGDSLLITAGLFAAQGHLDIVLLNILLITMAIAGDATGYLIGRSIGPRLFERPSTRWFRREHLLRTQIYYELHGGKTIVIARFVPVLRTFAPVVAGIARMDYRRFAVFNVSGAIGWVVSMTLIGYGLGRLFPSVDRFVEIVILAVIAISMIPIAINQWSSTRRSRLHQRNFDHSTRSILQTVRELRLDWTSEGLAHATQVLAAVHDAGSVNRSGVPPLDLRVTADGAGRPRLEIDSPPIDNSLPSTIAAREWLALELQKRYDETLRIANEILGAPTAAAETPSWRVENRNIHIVRKVEPHGAFRLSFILEPAEVPAGAPLS